MNNLFFELIHNTEKIKIDYKKSNIKINTTIFENYNNYIDKIKLEKFNNFTKKIIKLDEIKFDDTIYLFKIFNINIKNSVFIRANYINNKFEYFVSKTEDNSINSIHEKYDSIIQNVVSSTLYDEIKDSNRQHFLYEYTLTYISYFFDILNEKGNVFISFFNYSDPNTIEILYLLSCMFEKVIIYDGRYIYCSNFLDKYSTITKKDIENCIIKKHFVINPKSNLLKLVKYLEDIFKRENNLMKLLLNKSYDDYIDIKINDMYNSLIYINPSKETLAFFYKKIFNLLKRSFINNKIIKIHSSIKEAEGIFISNIINKNNYTKCLEIGMAFGISAFYILSNEKTNLISIDPYQKTQWNNYGVKLLKQFDFNKRHKCIEKKSYEALPELLKKEGEKSFDFIFIDGWHTFDYTLVDFFYSNLLLKINSIIIIDDALHAGVKKCINYLDRNYKFYEKINCPVTIACYRKIKDDNREWNFNENF